MAQPTGESYNFPEASKVFALNAFQKWYPFCNVDQDIVYTLSIVSPAGHSMAPAFTFDSAALELTVSDVNEFVSDSTSEGYDGAISFNLCTTSFAANVCRSFVIQYNNCKSSLKWQSPYPVTIQSTGAGPANATPPFFDLVVSNLANSPANYQLNWSSNASCGNIMYSAVITDPSSRT